MIEPFHCFRTSVVKNQSFGSPDLTVGFQRQNNNHTDRKGGQTYGQDHAYITRTLCQRYVLNSQEKKKESKNVVMNTKANTHHAALDTPLESQVEKKVYTHSTVSQKKVNRQGMGWGETETIIGKTARWGILALQLGLSPTDCFERNISGTPFYKVCYHGMWRV